MFCADHGDQVNPGARSCGTAFGEVFDLILSLRH